MTVFVDTSAQYAALDRDDENHASAREAWARLLREAVNLSITTPLRYCRLRVSRRYRPFASDRLDTRAKAPCRRGSRACRHTEEIERGRRKIVGHLTEEGILRVMASFQ